MVRARTKLLETLSRLPRYTCMQSLYRSVYRRAVQWPSCDGPAPGLPDSELQLESTDRLNLDIAVSSNGREIYSWAGAEKFQTEDVVRIIGTGAIGTGSFGPFLLNIFANPATQFSYRGEESLGGKPLMRYEFRVPGEASRYEFQTAGAKKIVPYDSAFWLDPESAELIRLQVHSATIPQETGTCAATTTIDFHSVPIGAGQYLLPRASLLEFSATSRQYVNAMAFSGCREYQGDSVIRFGEHTPGSQFRDAQTSRLPRRLKLLLALETPIDTERAAAGDGIVATVQKASGIVPAGAKSRGRILRLESEFGPRAMFYISIAWETMEFAGRSWPFSATLDPKVGPHTVSIQDVTSPRRRDAHFSSGQTLGFRTYGAKYIVPRGFESQWISID
jgi:hypothetical protein